MRKIGLALVLAVAPVAAVSAQTVPCGFTGSGASGTDCLGQGWQLLNGGWGIPGILAGTIPFAGTTGATEFHITFHAGGTFDGLIGFGDGVSTSPYDTRFWANGDYWNVTGAGNTISFFAPTGTAVDPNEDFFVNVEFLNGLPRDFNDVTFNAAWGPPTEVVPEPATMTLLATGLAGLAASRRRAKAKA